MKTDSMQIKLLSRLGQHKSFFGIGLPEIAREHPDLYAVTADLCGYSGMDRFARMYPEMTVNVGIAEQQMISIAAGLAMEGNLVYAGSYAAFATARAMEQVKHNMSVLNTNVKLVGYSSGYSKGALGISHWATEDIAMTRCLPNMTVISPADSLEAVKACIAVAEMYGPAYIRLCGAGMSPIVYQEDYLFEIGKGIVLRKGATLVIFAHGRMVAEVLKAADILAEQGISAEIVNMHTIKPLDVELIKKETQSHDLIYVIEEHNVTGGLGSAVAEIVSEMGMAVRVKRVGMQDCFYQLGTEKYIWEQAGLTDEMLAEMIKMDLE